jgi:hypothetical protein
MLDFGTGIDPTILKSGLRVVHFLGLALGLGTATFLDMMMVRFMVRGKIRRTHWLMLEFGSKMVTGGLVLLWLSGIGFLVWYGFFEPKNLGNPKIWAKVSIVAVLTINGQYLHGVVLPIFKGQVGRGLFEGVPTRERNMMVAGGVTSVLSWYFPVAIAASPWLNFNVPMVYIDGAYIAVLGFGLIFAMTLVALFARPLSAPIARHVPRHMRALGMDPSDQAARSAALLIGRYRDKYGAETELRLDEMPEPPARYLELT